MPHYKDQSDAPHYIEDIKFKSLLPAGCIEITEEEAELLAEERNAALSPPIIVPVSVTPKQARLAMLGAGILEDVERILAAAGGADGKRARIIWEYANEIRRDDPLLTALADTLDMTSEQIDQLFIAASAL